MEYMKKCLCCIVLPLLSAELNTVELHVLDGLSVHHQELKTAHTATGVCQTAAAIGDEVELQFHFVPASSSCLTYACCRMCSFELLKMGGKTV